MEDIYKIDIVFKKEGNNINKIYGIFPDNPDLSYLINKNDINKMLIILIKQYLLSNTNNSNYNIIQFIILNSPIIKDYWWAPQNIIENENLPKNLLFQDGKIIYSSKDYIQHHIKNVYFEKLEEQFEDEIKNDLIKELNYKLDKCLPFINEEFKYLFNSANIDINTDFFNDENNFMTEHQKNIRKCPMMINPN